MTCHLLLYYKCICLIQTKYYYNRFILIQTHFVHKRELLALCLNTIFVNNTCKKCIECNFNIPLCLCHDTMIRYNILIPWLYIIGYIMLTYISLSKKTNN